MKVISVWQPWATLIIQGFKFFETRSWAPPKSLIGQTIGIASTKTILPQQRSAANEEDFKLWYERSGLPSLEDLPCGYLLGTVQLHSFEHITDEFLDDITEEEKAFGWFNQGSYAWRLRNPVRLPHPVPIRGKQGIYDFYGLDPDRKGSEADGRPLGSS